MEKTIEATETLLKNFRDPLFIFLLNLLILAIKTDAQNNLIHILFVALKHWDC